MKGKNKEIIIAHPLDKLWMLPNKDKIYVMSFKQFCLPVLEFLMPRLYTARNWDIVVKEQILLQ